MMSKIKGEIRRSTDADMKEIEAWLLDQKARMVDGTFHCNWSLTIGAHDRGDLIVFVDYKSNEVVAYLWGGITGIDIVEVREDKRGQGIGKKLVNQRISFARKKNQNILLIECKPWESISFWEKMGFTMVESSSSNKKYAYFIIKRKHKLPLNGKLINLEISIYPEEKMWNSSAHSLRTEKPQSVITDDGKIHLEERISVPGRSLCNNKDLVVEIKIESDTLYCGKANNPKADSLGIKCCTNGYYMDYIITKKSNQL